MSSALKLSWRNSNNSISIPRPAVAPTRDRPQRGTPGGRGTLSLPPIATRRRDLPGPCVARRRELPCPSRGEPATRGPPGRRLQPRPGLATGQRGSLLLLLPSAADAAAVEGSDDPGREREAAARAPPFSLCLTPEAIGVLRKRWLAQGLRPGPDGGQRDKELGTPAVSGRGAGHVASVELVKGLGGEGFTETKVPEGLLRISLLNDRHRYDDVEYEDDGGDGLQVAGALHVDSGVRDKCMRWLRGLEEARGGHSLPHLIL